MDLNEKTKLIRYIYQGRIISLRNDDALLPDGRPCQREVVEHPGAVAIAAFTQEKELLLVRQFRYPYGKELLEIPAGKLEKGENPLEAGKRELLEECGVQAETYYSLGQFYPTPGYSNEVIHLFLATGLSYRQAQPDEDEFIEIERIPLEKILCMVMENELLDGKTQAAVLKIDKLLQENAILFA